MSRRSHYRSSKPARSGQPGTATTGPGSQPFAGGQPTNAPRPPVAAPPPAPMMDAPAGAVGHGSRMGVERPSANGNGHDPADVRPNGLPAPAANGHAPANGHAAGNGHPPTGPGADSSPGPSSGCTAPQLRRFIKSRSWVPMHELRRRFAINGGEDDVTPVAVDGETIFVGLPSREGRLLGELFQAGDIGYELSMDPCTPIVIGVYPMRPVPRH